MAFCNVCPRKCGIDRSLNTGVCGMNDKIKIAQAALHYWEEPCISGEKGSGAVFFSGCSLKCVYCQNAEISWNCFGSEVTFDGLMRIFDQLIKEGAHNINLVTPTHFAPMLADILREYKSAVPVVYNSSGYETVETIKSMEGLVDIYLPDLKYFGCDISMKYSNAENYFEFASKAILEMQYQMGSLQLDEKGIAQRGVIIRHLVLPGNVAQTFKILKWISENLPAGTAVSLMSQYTPCWKAAEFPTLERKITKREYERAVNALFGFGFENGYVQDLNSSGNEYIPSFNLKE